MPSSIKNSYVLHLLGLLLTLFGFIVICGWLFHLPSLMTIIPGGSKVMFNAACSFMLSGLALLSFTLPKKLFNQHIPALLGGLIIFLSILTLRQVAFADSNYTEQMALNTCLCFLSAGFVLLALSYSKHKITNIGVQLCVFVIFFLAFSALLGHLLNLHLLYTWSNKSEMPIPTAIGLIGLSVGLFSSWKYLGLSYDFYQHQLDKKIIILSGLIFLMMAYTVGMGGLAIIKEDSENLLNNMTVLQEIENPLKLNQQPALHTPAKSFGYDVTKHIDSYTLYHSLRNQLIYILVIVAVVLLSCLGFIKMLIGPLVKRIVHSETKVKEHALLLSESESRLNAIMRNSADGIITVNENGSIISFNKKAEEIFKFSELEMITQPITTIIPQIDLIDSDEMIQKSGKRKTNEIFPIELSIAKIPHGKQIFFAIIIRDITHQKKTEQDLLFKAHHDPLTGLANRARLEYYLNTILCSAKRNQKMFAIFYLDLDRFKPINDQFGHDIGDALLKYVAGSLTKSVRDTDLVVRLGGDEFVIVFTDVKEMADVAASAEKIINLIIKPIEINMHELNITASIGISIYPYDGQDIETLLKNSDIALYRAKQAGRNNYQFFKVDSAEILNRRIDFEKTLPEALAQEEFRLYYQPILNVKDNVLVSMEALLNWSTIKYGTISPKDILPIAEETGLIFPLSDWILRTASQQVVAWKKNKYNLRVAINVAPRLFRSIHFLTHVKQILDHFNLAGSHFEFEFSESLIMQDPERSRVQLIALKKMGVHITLDDFGTGYTSLVYLKKLPITQIKITRQLIKDITIDSVKLDIVAAIIAMGLQLKLRVVAVGVESKEQLDLLIKHNCYQIQGYLISEPISAELASQFIQKNKIRFNNPLELNK